MKKTLMRELLSSSSTPQRNWPWDFSISRRKNSINRGRQKAASLHLTCVESWPRANMWKVQQTHLFLWLCAVSSNILCYDMHGWRSSELAGSPLLTGKVGRVWRDTRRSAGESHISWWWGFSWCWVRSNLLLSRSEDISSIIAEKCSETSSKNTI